MVTKGKLYVVLSICLVMVLSMLLVIGNQRVESSEFVGVCVYSGDGFSILTDGQGSVGVYSSLEVGRVYRVTGVPFNSSSGIRIRPESIEQTEPTFPLETTTGAYWPSRGYYLLTPTKVRLAVPLDIPKGEFVRVEGMWYGGKFYPVRYSRVSPPKEPSDGMPWAVEGTILYSGQKTVLWNGSEEIALYLPYGTELKPGQRVRVLGIVRFYSTLSLLVDSKDDVALLGMAQEKPLMGAEIGDIATGTCMVVESGRSLRLNCTDMRVYGFSARRGDVIQFKALRRKSSLLCLNCIVVNPRESLPNGICSFSEGKFARIAGNVSWVKVYRNGFGIANVTHGDCWIIIKLRKSLNVSVQPNETLEAYGFFTTYRNMPAFEVNSGDDLCCGNC